MQTWKPLFLFLVPALGVLSFLRVVSNEIQAVERRLTLLAAAEDARKSAEARRKHVA